MPIAPGDVTWIEEPKIGVLGRLYLPAIVTGLQTTVRHMFGPKVTVEFPEQQPILPPNYRGVHRLAFLRCGPGARRDAAACSRLFW